MYYEVMPGEVPGNVWWQMKYVLRGDARRGTRERMVANEICITR